MNQNSLHPPESADEDAAYRDLIDSISVSAEELSVLITMPEIQSVEQARRFVRNVQIEPMKTSGGWFDHEMEKMTAHVRQLSTAISLGLIGLRQGRHHRRCK